MNEKQELLTILMEECAEVSIEASKLIRFGTETWAEVHSLEQEVGDLLCMIELLAEYHLISMTEVREAIKAKREKLKKWSNLDV